jgi:predicted transcriptional regulator
MVASNLIELAAEVVTAFVSNNPLPKGELPSLFHIVHTAVVRPAARQESAQLHEVRGDRLTDGHRGRFFLDLRSANVY